jgi:glycosyltransferase involved in cell wall biosynthesis
MIIRQVGIITTYKKVDTKVSEKRVYKSNIAFVVRRIPHYRLPFYELFIDQNKHININIYHGTQEAISGGSGLITNTNYPFANKLRSFNIGSSLFQTGLIKTGIINKYQIVIFEGSVRIISSLFVLIIRKLLGKKNIIWTKGWFKETKISKISYLFKKYYLSLADSYIVYGSESIKSLELYKIKSSKITIAQNTVDVQDIISKKYLNDYEDINNEKIKQIIISGTPYIYNVGRIISPKRVDDLIDSFHKINAASFNTVQLVIAGSGPEVETLKEKVNHLNLNNVHLLGTISETDSKMLYGNCLFCVFPGWVGLSLNEAMAAGKAVICADEPGPDSELLIHNYNGLRYKKGNINQLAEYMKYLVNNNELRNNLGQRAFETITKKATLNNMVSKFSLVVNEFLT